MNKSGIVCEYFIKQLVALLNQPCYYYYAKGNDNVFKEKLTITHIFISPFDKHLSHTFLRSYSLWMQT